MAEMVTEDFGAYEQGRLTGFLKRFPVDVEKLKDLMSAEEYKQNCQRPNGCFDCQKQLFERQFPIIRYREII